MDNEAVLKTYAKTFKESFPAVMAEAVMCYAVVAGTPDPLTVGHVGEKVGLTEPQAYKELASLSAGAGVGLVSFVNMGDGRNQVKLTPKGAQFRDVLQQKLGL
ncbi:hypothetical protein QGN29_08355 [Temperatibacter marinus]|uniref:Uncharacterized protein n=1 Tax=Temperatibacter marinus TaxID=1456591 RepID=A0AA52EEY1_9PROT|nr:hypothetical protein [Temperatibacter marinus]WND01570.1 hypothetical protein QGN29_08355 [Temperatibacter marinus]